METCKFCNAELEENSTVCPKCGKDNAAEAPVTVPEAAEEKKPEKQVSAGITILALTAIVAVLILLAAFVLNGRTVEEVPDVEEPAAVEETAVEMTVPADGNPDDVTCKGTYTASDDDVYAAKDVVVATAGSHELTLSQLQVFYWMEVRNFMTQYGAYAAYFGLDIQQPLDTQICNVMETPMTWQQYFLDSALHSWASYTAMAAEGEANGYELPELQRNAVENVAEQLDSSAQQNGFESGEAMLHSSLGSAVSVEDYRTFMETYYKANGYYNQLAEAVHPTAEELDAFFEEHLDGYTQSGITKDSKYVDVRHILILPEGVDASTIGSTEVSEEAWAAGEAAAQALLEEWLAGDATEESFAALANEHSTDPGSNTNGGLYQNVTEGMMVQSFNDWCFDPARVVGDTGIVKTEYGFHIMYFVGSRAMWTEYAESDFIGEAANAQASAIAGKYPLAAKYDSILLSNVELN